MGRTLCMSYKNLYCDEINIPQTVKPFTHFLHWCNSKLPWCGIYGRGSSRKDWNILCLQEKSQFPCLAHTQMSITRKIRNIKEIYWHKRTCARNYGRHTQVIVREIFPLLLRTSKLLSLGWFVFRETLTGSNTTNLTKFCSSMTAAIVWRVHPCTLLWGWNINPL